MRIENRLDELQVHTRQCNVWRWCATDIYFLCSSLHFSSQHFVSFLYLSFSSLSFHLISNTNRPMHTSWKKKKICFEPHCRSKLAILYKAKNNNWMGKQQCKHMHLEAADNVCSRLFFAWSLLQVQLLNSKECLAQTTAQSLDTEIRT